MTVLSVVALLCLATAAKLWLLDRYAPPDPLKEDFDHDGRQ